MSWSAPTASPASGGNSWDHMNAAHQLAGLGSSSQDPIAISGSTPIVRSGLQHERPVAMQQPPPAPRRPAPAAPMYEALDLDDLQNFLSWDMYGIRDMGDPIIDEGMPDDLGLQAWAGAI